MTRRLREDVHALASVAGVAAALVALAGWVAGWPGSVLPTALLVLGVAATTVGRALELPARARALPPPLRLPALVAHGGVSATVAVAMCAHPAVARAVGAVAVGILAVTAIARAAPPLRRRYRGAGRGG